MGWKASFGRAIARYFAIWFGWKQEADSNRLNFSPHGCAAASHPSYPLPNGDPLLYGAADAVLHSGAVWYNADVLPWQVLFFQAHEFSHHWLHSDICVCADCSID